MKAAMTGAVAVCIVTYNDADDLPASIESVCAQSQRPLELVIVDNASHDASAHVATELVASLPSWLPGQALANDANLGFAAGMNQAYAATAAPLLLTLNADARPEPDYIERLVTAASRYESTLHVGAVTGRLSREVDAENPNSPPLLDACGMMLKSAWRHLDRG